MARYKSLKSIAHNFAHSFVSLENYAGNDYAMCHLIRRSRLTGFRKLTLDILRRDAGPLDLLSPHLIAACKQYCDDFGRLVTTGGAALHMVSRATLAIAVVPAGGGGLTARKIHARVHAVARIVDDRGRAHIGRAEADYPCAPLR